jgi:hypothetical protein
VGRDLTACTATRGVPLVLIESDGSRQQARSTGLIALRSSTTLDKILNVPSDTRTWPVAMPRALEMADLQATQGDQSVDQRALAYARQTELVEAHLLEHGGCGGAGGT